VLRETHADRVKPKPPPTLPVDEVALLNESDAPVKTNSPSFVQLVDDAATAAAVEAFRATLAGCDGDVVEASAIESAADEGASTFAGGGSGSCGRGAAADELALCVAAAWSADDASALVGDECVALILASSEARDNEVLIGP